MFRSSGNLAGAYGIAVTIDMLITTTMTFFVVRYGWKYPWSLSFAATGFFFVVDLVYFSANIVKVIDGGWFPLLIGGLMNTASRKLLRSIASSRRRSDISSRPRFQVIISVNISAPRSRRWATAAGR